MQLLSSHCWNLGSFSDILSLDIFLIYILYYIILKRESIWLSKLNFECRLLNELYYPKQSNFATLTVNDEQVKFTHHHHHVHWMDTGKAAVLCSEGGNPMASCPAVQNSQQLTQKSTASLPTATYPESYLIIFILHPREIYTS